MSHKRTLLLDRDGVINELLPNDYVKSINQFVFKENVPEEIGLLSMVFDYVFIITNQQGVGKGLMSHEDLENIHEMMLIELEKKGGRITGIYSCTHLKEENCDCRKPKPGMIHSIFEKYTDIKPENCLFVGDSPSDITLAKNLEIPAVVMKHAHNLDTLWQPSPDYFISNLRDLRMKILPLLL